MFAPYPVKNYILWLLLAAMTALFFISTYTDWLREEEETHPRLKQMEWLLHRWENVAEDGNVSIESWKAISSDRLEGQGILLSGQDTLFGETLTIQLLNDDIVYIAQLEGQPPTLFTLIESSEEFLLFENKEHSYPQQIGYEKVGSDSLVTYIDGYTKSKTPISAEFRFAKSK